ncbi:MAG: hypothetical protein AB1861_27915 [Cyanobacteriota bacterium]
MRSGKILGVFTGTAAILATTSYWYVFVAGASQLAPPQMETNTGLTFELQTFNSGTTGEVLT